MFDVIAPLILQFLKMFLHSNPLSIFHLIYSFLVSTECCPLVFYLLYDMSIDVLIVMIDATVHVLTLSLDLSVEIVDSIYD